MKVTHLEMLLHSVIQWPVLCNLCSLWSAGQIFLFLYCLVWSDLVCNMHSNLPNCYNSEGSMGLGVLRGGVIDFQIDYLSTTASIYLSVCPPPLSFYFSFSLTPPLFLSIAQFVGENGQPHYIPHSRNLPWTGKLN